ncbi:hypothetical protein [Actinomadura rudentiformis]|uniref:Oxidoreductase n=1 Tax=Actinomadura rudentiformis TaxID=359158 RepID=A0A6H9YQ02_9ACTN|nr:hypothetical protein [Actinomadura rudentiformis]KAB2344921.1 hypothetical protein F8566_30505 [Actinomadura rudentiformis]
MATDGLEQRLLDTVRDGEMLDLAGDGPVDEAAMRSWDSTRTVPAVLIRDLVRGRRDIEADPHGLRLRGARITGRVDLANITSDLRVELIDCLVPDGLNLCDSRLPGLVLDGSCFGHSAGSHDPPVDAERFTVPAMTMSGAIANADTPAGAVRFLGAHLGRLECDGAQLQNASGPALHADGLRVDHGVFLRGGFQATGAGERGTVRFVGAHLGRLECDGAQLQNLSGPALHADGLRVDRAMSLRGGFRATGAIQMVDAHLGLLECDGARLENPFGPALYADGLRVDRAVHLRGGFQATGAGHSVLRLNGVSVGGSLWLDTSKVTRSGRAPGALVAIDGLTYTGLPEPVELSRWLELLRAHTPGYAAQPYQQLAAVHRTAGHDSEAREILRAQRRDQIDRGGLGRRDRVWARFTGLTLGFGYQPWRVLLLLFAVVACSVALALILGGPGGGLEHTARANTPKTPCGVVKRVGVGLDLSLPLVKTGARDQCAPTDTRAGQTLTVAGWVLQLVAWASATLFIAGFTGAVRTT